MNTNDRQQSDAEFERKLDELLAEGARIQEALKHRRANPYVQDLIEILLPHPGGHSQRIVLQEIKKPRRANGLPMPRRLEEAVQSAFNRFNRESSVFRGTTREAIFHSVGGKGSGLWAVHSSSALTWLEENS